MADSTGSDADKIRAKRLAKLGGPAPSSPSPQSTSNDNPAQPASSPAQGQPAATSPTPKNDAATEQTSRNGGENPFSQLGMNNAQQTQPEKKAAPQIKIRPRPASPPVKRERDGSERPKASAEKPSEPLETWQDRNLRHIFRVTLKSEETKDTHGHPLIFLTSTKDELAEQNAPMLLSAETLEGVITEAASNSPRGEPFEYLLGCFKRASRAIRGTKYSGPEDPKHDILKEARRLCMSYCIFSVTMPEMFSDNAPTSNPLVEHLLTDPEGEAGICQDFLNEVDNRFEEDETIKEAFISATEELSRRLSTIDMLGDYGSHVRGLLSLVRSKPIANALTESSIWCPPDIQAQDIETKTLLGPFFKLSPMQPAEARNFFSSPKTRDRGFITNNQDITRQTLRAHQYQLFQIVNTIVRASPAARERVLDWFATCVNKNHRRRAMRVDYKIVSTDGFMVNVTNILDQLCEPFTDVSYTKIDRIDVDYLRRTPRVDISDETKINADQKAADEFYADKADGTSNFISEIFFLTVAAHHYGTEATQTRLGPMRKSAQRAEKDLVQMEGDRHKYINNPAHLQQFDNYVKRMRDQVDDLWSTIHATYGIIVDTDAQARSTQFMRYVIVWLLRLASCQNLPQEKLQIPLPEEQREVVKCLPEYLLEDVVDNFKFITSNIPQILSPQQCDEIIQVCVTFLRNSEYVKNPGVKSGLVTILYYGCQPLPNRSRGVLGDLLIGSEFANKHLLHALMKFYIEAESTGSHTQFYDKFNIRFEIFQVIKCIWANPLYRENLAKEAQINTDFFVQFVNMLVNDVTFVLDESLSSFIKIHDLSRELADEAAMAALDEEQRKAKEELLEDNKGKAKSYMQLTRETMEMLILFSESLADAFTMPEIVTRLADMLDYNLDTMVGPRRKNLIVADPTEYGFQPTSLLSDIMRVYTNLSAKNSFVQAIARDGRSYKPANFSAAEAIMANSKTTRKSPDELRLWSNLASNVAEAKAAEEEEEADLGDAPDEFMDPLVFDLMDDPVVLPTSKTVMNRSTIRSHLLSDPTDPFNRSPLRIEDVVADVELKGRIEAWKAEKKAARAAERAGGGAGGEKMDLS